MGWIGAASVAALPTICTADTNVDDFIRSGRVAMPMGVSGQAGKSRPETGVVLRDGSDVSRDSRTGDVLAELVVKGTHGDKAGVLASFSSPWPIGKSIGCSLPSDMVLIEVVLFLSDWDCV